ncbi:MAG TPA: Rieske (2Fe-2S) protein [Acetobacteraceae bacterium]|jgi:3-phenylpropionate/trans-cinnamate dioxygenase ferredoxin subunit|nr:Rieske (2Fe-2S) protein [Acetobacteraceae bacterium]
MARHVVAAVGEIPPGERKIVTVRGREIGVFNIGGEYFALLNRCPHQGGELCRGTLIGLVTSSEPGRFDYSRPGEMLKCPWHGWEYDIRTGQSWCDPNDTKAKAYAVTVEPGETLARGPFVAETFTVSVEQAYIVVEL